jgi:protease-4
MAERTTITGSIGVYAAFPNISELAQKWGVKLDVIKRGDVKASGSMFHDMTPQERQLWQDMIDHAYDQFLDVVRKGRGKSLKYDLTEAIPDENRMIPARIGADNGERVPYTRKLADGGIFTAEKAKQYGLIDEIGYLEDAVAVAARQANLNDDYKVIRYEKPRTLWSYLLEVKAPNPAVTATQAAGGAMPRIWYLLPESGISGILTASGIQWR